MCGHTRNGRLIEQVGSVFEDPLEPWQPFPAYTT